MTLTVPTRASAPPNRRPASRGRTARRLIAVLVVLGVLALGLAGWDTLRTMVHRAMVSQPVPTALGIPIGSGTGATSAPAVLPEQLFIPSIGLNAPIAAKASVTRVDPFTGSRASTFGVPSDAYSTAWWSEGPRPGAEAMAVVLGHTEVGRYGVFDALPTLAPGSVIGVEGGGALLRYVVTGVRTGLPKSDPAALASALTNPPPGTGLALVTCSGQVDPDRNSHEDNTVVFARLADWTAL